MFVCCATYHRSIFFKDIGSFLCYSNLLLCLREQQVGLQVRVWTEMMSLEEVAVSHVSIGDAEGTRWTNQEPAEEAGSANAVN